MKLYASAASPFVRKVRVLAEEVGLGHRLEVLPVTLSPTAPDPELSSKNPLGKIPALELDDGTVVFDSRVICELLDELHDGPRMVPSGPTARARATTTHALADGVVDAGILLRYETVLRPEPYRWSDWIEGQGRKVTGGLAALEASLPREDAPLDLAQIAVGCALGWLEFRRPLDVLPSGAVDLATRFPALMAWFAGVRTRPSFRATEPS